MDTHTLTGKVKPNQVARLGNDGANFFRGEIDNVQLYRAGLSADDVRFLYTGIKRTTAVEGKPALPEDCSLSQNYPNPFNHATLFSYYVPGRSPVTIAVYDRLGKKVATLVDGVSSGENRVEFRGESLPTGIYFVRLQAGAGVVTRKVLLLK